MDKQPTHTKHQNQPSQGAFLFTPKISEEKKEEQGLPFSIRKITAVADNLSQMKPSGSSGEKEVQIRQIRAAFQDARYANI